METFLVETFLVETFFVETFLVETVLKDCLQFGDVGEKDYPQRQRHQSADKNERVSSRIGLERTPQKSCG